MGKVILIILLWYGGKNVAATAEFDSMSACRAAQSEVTKVWGNIGGATICVPKGSAANAQN